MASDNALTWLEEELRNERKQVELTLAANHARLLKQLAPMLDASKKSVPPPSTAAIVDTPTNRQRQMQELGKDEVTPDDEGAGWSGCLPCGARPPPQPVEADLIGSDPAEMEPSKDGQAVVPSATGEAGNEVQPEGWKSTVTKILEHWLFDAFIGTIIVANSTCIGIETSFELDNKNTDMFGVLEHIFLAIYIIELVCRFTTYGCRACLGNPWVAFDLLLVLLGAMDLYIVKPVTAATQDGAENQEIAGLMVLRMLRLFRLARLVKMMYTFKVLWKLINGLLGSVGTIFYTFCLIGLILYIFSCMSLQLITKAHRDSSNADIQALVTTYFPNLQVTMLSLIQFVTIDSLAGFYFPLIVEDPKLLLFFIPFILVVSISMVNLVTAVIVDGAIEQSRNDRDTQKAHDAEKFRKILPILKKRFADMDEDGNDLLTVEEVLNAPEDVKHSLEEFGLDDENALAELFEMIDVDESGEINCDEFCDGIFKLVNSEAPVELVRILKQLKMVRKELGELKSGQWITQATFSPQLSKSKGDLTKGDNADAGAV